MTFYVYRIECRPTGQMYYGSTNNLQDRWLGHLRSMRENDDRPLYQAMREHGVGQFTMTTLSTHSSKHNATLVEGTHTRLAKEQGKSLNVHTYTVANRPCCEGGSRQRSGVGNMGPKMSRQQQRREYWRRVRAREIEAPFDYAGPFDTILGS